MVAYPLLNILLWTHLILNASIFWCKHLGHPCILLVLVFLSFIYFWYVVFISPSESLVLQVRGWSKVLVLFFCFNTPKNGRGGKKCWNTYFYFGYIWYVYNTGFIETKKQKHLSHTIYTPQQFGSNPVHTHKSQIHPSLSYPGKSKHDIALLGLGIPKALDVESTDSKIWGAFNITHTHEEGKQEEGEGPHGTELGQWPYVWRQRQTRFDWLTSTVCVHKNHRSNTVTVHHVWLALFTQMLHYHQSSGTQVLRHCLFTQSQATLP